MNKTEAPIGTVDEKQLEAWKQKFKCKAIRNIITPEEGSDKEHITYFAPSEMKHLDILSDYQEKKQTTEGLKVLFNTLRIGGSDEVLEYVDLNKSAILGSALIHKSAQSSLGKPL